MKPSLRWASVALLAGSPFTEAIDLDINSQDSIRTAAGVLAHDMMLYYSGNNTGQTPGNLPSPYYWWEAGAMFGSMIDYWYYTGDATYNAVTTQAMLYQVGPNQDYMTPNQTKTTGNDDQSFWGLAAMTAAEVNFPDPPKEQPQWLALAQAVFNTQVPRWDPTTCGGGLRWQVFPFNNGYNYKNAISNGCFFNLASRLARYTGNATYAEWAEKAYTWMRSINLTDENYYVYDGSDDLINCTQLNRIQWTYNAGAMLLGAATMYNYTNGSALWEERTWGLLNATDVFFQDDIMFEVACESVNRCNVDQQSFKAYLSRWMAATTKAAPFTYDTIMARLRPSATAAAKQCGGGDNKRTCGMKWTQNSTWDGTYGVGQQMAALEVVQANLIGSTRAPVTNTTGGTSRGNNAAGTNNTSTLFDKFGVKKGDRVGAGFLTTVVLCLFLGMIWWMVVE